MEQIKFDDVSALQAKVSEEFGPFGGELEVTQKMINRFAELTGDRQWIHVDVERCRRESPFGGPIAHGFLTLSILPALNAKSRDAEDWVIVGQGNVANYGSDKLRFLSPVPAGQPAACALATRRRRGDSQGHARRTRDRGPRRRQRQAGAALQRDPALPAAAGSGVDAATMPASARLLRAPRPAALVFIFVTVVLDMLALGLIVPVLPKLVVEFMAGDTAGAARIYGVFGTAWALMQLIFSPLLGALSDRFGRRPVILISLFGLGLDYVLMALAPSLSWLFVGRVISGITAATFATAGAYVADVTPPERRAAGYGLLGAAFGLGFVLGPALGGLLGSIGPRLPFWAAAGLTLANAAYGLLILPESLPRERRARFEWRRANPIGSLRLARLPPAAARARRGGLPLQRRARRAAEHLRALHDLPLRVGRAHDRPDAGGCRRVRRDRLRRAGRLRRSRSWASARRCSSGSRFGVAGFLTYGLAPTGAIFWLGVPLVSLWGLSGPAMQGLMTRHVAASEQGQLQGARSSLMGIAGLVAPTLFTQTFAAFISTQRDLAPARRAVPAGGDAAARSPCSSPGA